MATGGLFKDRMIYDAADLTGSDQVGANLIAGSKLTSTLIGGTKQSLDVNVANTLAISVDGIYNVSTNATPDNVGIIAFSRGATDVTSEVQLPTAAVPADSVANADVTGIDVNSFLMGYNGTTWDRIKSTSGALDVNIASGALEVTLGDLVADDAADAGGSLKVGSRAVSGALSAVSATNDRADLLSDMYRRLFVTNSPNVSIKSTNVTVGLTAVAVPTTALAGRQKIVMQNLSDKDMFIGDSNVTTSLGIRIARGATYEMELAESVVVYAICGTAGKTLSVMEVA